MILKSALPEFGFPLKGSFEGDLASYQGLLGCFDALLGGSCDAATTSDWLGLEAWPTYNWGNPYRASW